MGKTRVGGIGGVLGDLISDDRPKPKPTEKTGPATPKRPSERQPTHTRARTGRPTGKGNAGPTRKEKLTVRIDADLAAAYRDWSWDARCNLGELVSRAMRAYLKNRRNN